MRCLRQPAFLYNKPTPICDIWEVRLSSRLWQHLRKIASIRRCTYSTITRFCIFQLAEFEQLRCTALFTRINSEIRKDSVIACQFHRHMVCLYGDDVKLLRLAAMQLNMTVSAFIRLALWRYLPRLAQENRSHRNLTGEQLFRLGTKRWMIISYSGLNHERSPAMRQFAFASFPAWFWW